MSVSYDNISISNKVLSNLDVSGNVQCKNLVALDASFNSLSAPLLNQYKNTLDLLASQQQTLTNAITYITSVINDLSENVIKLDDITSNTLDLSATNMTISNTLLLKNINVYDNIISILSNVSDISQNIILIKSKLLNYDISLSNIIDLSQNVNNINSKLLINDSSLNRLFNNDLSQNILNTNVNNSLITINTSINKLITDVSDLSNSVINSSRTVDLSFNKDLSINNLDISNTLTINVLKRTIKNLRLNNGDTYSLLSSDSVLIINVPTTTNSIITLKFPNPTLMTGQEIFISVIYVSNNITRNIRCNTDSGSVIVYNGSVASLQTLSLASTSNRFRMLIRVFCDGMYYNLTSELGP